ncbi:esterase/lipase family protein, partial [Streptosporangium jomthongense]
MVFWMRVAAAVSVGVAVSGAVSVAADETRADDARPVVFVHGLHADPGVWASMKERFEKSTVGDFPPTRLHAFDYSETTEDHIADNAKRLSDWLSSEHLGEVDVVSHSMGGLVARKAQEDGATI